MPNVWEKMQEIFSGITYEEGKEEKKQEEPAKASEEPKNQEPKEEVKAETKKEEPKAEVKEETKVQVSAAPPSSSGNIDDWNNERIAAMSPREVNDNWKEISAALKQGS